ncbi:YceI family protein [Streptacidiphilus rugosus]|uniref:YceI family protein n=1 Tax=Streptacidiphilus rugosus TaxID=405783 RepID=UPI0006920883|nr:YceI family protein [Streptacidiphilus rugosus]
MTTTDTDRLATGSWRLAPEHSTARFTAANFLFRRVPGTIALRTGTAVVGPDGVPCGASAELDPASISTGHERRDGDLRGKRFLRVAHFPAMGFRADRVEPQTDGTLLVRGRLTVADTTAPLDLTAIAHPASTQGRRSVTATGRLDLRTVGIRVPAFLVGRMIDISVDATLLAPET